MNLFTRLLFFICLFTLSGFSSDGQVAIFTASPTSGCAPLVVYFNNGSTGAGSYHWNFGNGTTSVLANPSSSYLSPGTYTATLAAYNAAGTDSSLETVTITVYPAPSVDFVANDTAVCPGVPVIFSSTGSAGVSGSVTYSWNFGDGDSSIAAMPSHSFTSPGYKNITLSVTNSKGCVASYTRGAYIDVYTPPVANFASSSTAVCNPPGSVTFDNESTGTAPLSYEWSMGGGSTSSATDPTNTYSTTGSYNVTLVTTDGHGCVDSITKPGYIVVGSFTASFTAPTTACIYAPVTFDNTTGSSAIANTWYFGTSGTSTLTSPTYIFYTAGTYNVKLIVFNGACYDTVVHTITILPEPTSNFTWTPAEPCSVPATQTFNATGPGGSTVTWKFGDGGTGTGTSDSHTYANDGTDTVQMIFTDASGCKDTVTHIDTLLNLIVQISHAIDSSGCVPLTINFQGFDISTIPYSSAYPYAVTSYLWNFGDGSPTSSLATPTHTYTAAGTYTATYTIITANGCTQTTTKTIIAGVRPVASFSATPTTVCYDTVVSFTNLSTGASNYAWFFGDSSGSTLIDPTHQYLLPDTGYSVMLVAYNNGCPDTFIHHYYITVDSPKAIINYALLCSPATAVSFGDRSLGDDTHLWIFSDGITTTATDTLINFPTLSTYTVTLTTFNIRSGCRDTSTETIDLVKPVPTFTANVTAICKNGIVHFNPGVTGGSAMAYEWYVNNSFIAADSFFTDTFTTTGLYTIMLVIQDQDRCLDSFQRSDYITVAKPVASFTSAPPSGCWPLTVLFTDRSTDVTGVIPTNFSWSFGDGGTAAVSTPDISHTYSSAGIFSIQEIVTDNIGCKDTVVLPDDITVYKPAASFYSATAYPCIGIPDNFTNLSSGIASSLWFFGDGGTSTATSPSYTYTASGTYTVKLVVTDIHGCTDTANYANYIDVTTANAAFYMTDSFSLCPPLTVDFINTSTGAVSYKWYLGDGSTSILISPTDLYTTTVYDTILLIAENVHGCYDTAVGHVNLFGGSGGFTYGPVSGCTPLTVRFNASTINVPNIIWDFADGTTTLASYSDTASHTYTIPGAYVPKLILSDNTGCQQSSQGPDTIKVDGINTGFTTEPAPVCINTDFTFKDTSHSYFSTITSWLWTFTSGDTSSLSAPTYEYSAVGSYPVSLLVQDGWGCRDSVTEEITVYPPPVITVSPDTVVCLGDAGQLTGYGGTSYTWAPPATVSCTNCITTQATPTVITQYTVTGTDIHGCTNTDTVSVFLKTNTISQGTGDTEICQGETVPLYDTGGTSYTWIPATGLNNDNIYDPLATPQVSTTYTVIAKLASCIADTNYITVIVHPLPTVNAGNDQTLVAGAQAQLEANGTDIATYNWTPAASLSCGSCSNPVASMSVTTTYDVDVATSYGCRSSDSVTIHIICDKSQIFIPNSFTPNGDGQDDVFYPRGTGISTIKSFRIYNRWGELLFEKTGININDASNAWDGTYNNATPRPDVYVYIIDALCDTGEPINLKGDVTIIR